MNQEHKPYISPEQNIPELTVQAVVLGLLLSVIMCAANMYTGLKAGMTVGAAIPASVISMGILRGLLKRGTILENNTVHTIASSGESLAAGIIFTVPALVLLGLWEDFKYWETTLIAMSGGIIGVVMMIPLRKAMIVDQRELKYPEGVACAEVLKAGDKGGTEMLGIFGALGVGAAFKMFEQTIGLFKGSIEAAASVSRTAFYIGTDISPMLAAVGFIVGWEISLLVFLGGAISYVGAIPVLAWDYAYAGNEGTLGMVNEIWDQQIRFFGIGAMVIAGVYSIIKILGSIGTAVGAAFAGIRGKEDTASLPRTEQNITGKLLLACVAGCLVLSAIIYYMMTHSVGVTVLTTVLMFILSFFFVAVASYIVGLVGSSNSPVSGMTICAVLVTATLLLALGYTGEEGMLATLGVAGVVCCATCTSGDICQDLKIAHILGATPRRLQIAELFGTAIPALTVAWTLTLLHEAYGIGTEVREGVDYLPAPQAGMFKELVGGIFDPEGSLPWNLLAFGAGVGVLAILIDKWILEPKRSAFRLYPMPLAVGMYLPWTVTFPILIGGVIFKIVQIRSRARGDDEEQFKGVVHKGLLFASGLVAGEAIYAILAAIIVVAWTDEKFVPESWVDSPWRGPLSFVVFALILVTLVKKSLSRKDA